MCKLLGLENWEQNSTRLIIVNLTQVVFWVYVLWSQSSNHCNGYSLEQLFLQCICSSGNIWQKCKHWHWSCDAFVSSIYYQNTFGLLVQNQFWGQSLRPWVILLPPLNSTCNRGWSRVFFHCQVYQFSFVIFLTPIPAYLFPFLFSYTKFALYLFCSIYFLSFHLTMYPVSSKWAAKFSP